MINITDKTKYPHDRVIIDADTLSLHMIDERYKQGIVGYSHQFLDLKQLAKIQLIHEYPDTDKRRQDAINKTNENRVCNSTVGGIVGGLIDGLDGVIIGAIAGAVLTEVEKIDLKELSEHNVNLLFRNGLGVGCVVDVEGMAELLRIAHAHSLLTNTLEVKNPLGHAPLTNEQLNFASQAAKDNYITENQWVSHSLFYLANILMTLGAGCVIAKFIAKILILPFKNGLSGIEGLNAVNAYNSSFQYHHFLYILLFGLLLSLLGFILRKKENLKISHLLAMGEGGPVTENEIPI